MDLDDSVRRDVTGLILVKKDNAAPKARGAFGHQSMHAMHRCMDESPKAHAQLTYDECKILQMRESQTPRQGQNLLMRDLCCNVIDGYSRESRPTDIQTMI